MEWLLLSAWYLNLEVVYTLNVESERKILVRLSIDKEQGEEGVSCSTGLEVSKAKGACVIGC